MIRCVVPFRVVRWSSSRNSLTNSPKTTLSDDVSHSETWDPNHERWEQYWPTPQTFSPAIPLHLTQGGQNPATSYKNTTEMLKIPNFFHLTPAHIKAHCDKLKDLCTKFPPALINSPTTNFPVTTIFTDFIFNSPSVRYEGSNKVTLKVSVPSLKLDAHGFDKLRRLCQDKYDHSTGILTLTSSKCPTRKQNYDYLRYVLSVLFMESKKVDKWETEDKELEDYEHFEWERSCSARNLEALKEITTLEEEAEESYSTAVTDLYTLGETEDTLRAYGEAVEKLFSKTE